MATLHSCSFSSLHSLPSVTVKYSRAQPRILRFHCRSSSDNKEDYLLDAPVSVGDGFSFSGGKYSDEPSPADEWFNKGKFVKAYPVSGTGEKAKDPIFGLTMGGSSQASSDLFRWFCVESGSSNNSSILLIHGLPSQAYSYRKVLPILENNYHTIALDWLEYVASLESVINALTDKKVTLVVQGYFSPIAIKYASNHQEKLNGLILLNPPLTINHAKLPSSLSVLSNFLLGEIFCQDPLRASDKTLLSCGPYQIKEDVAMVYRRPYLTSGSAGFALNAISKAMKKQLKRYVEDTRAILMDNNWSVQTTVCWGQRDRWLSFDGVEDFCKESKHRLVELPMSGHHVQEDSGEGLGQLIAGIVGKRSSL
ncbi:hypothetical protein RDI58_022403 [Solanum bulbocastanum]|uniref:AB hydrolase-1 domain-containing protein n=1 Tax=Solanum bulbocastanum TaxID=147425 RepID=A0AAN8Y5L8_SOLBU